MEAPDTRPLHKVPNPYPLTLAGMLAALGPQAINFGISIGGGEAYLLPNISARGTLHMHWLMTVSVVLETALVYECIKYSVCTGRSFFAATNDLKPFGFWPWFWAFVSVVTFAWPAWMGGAVIAAHRFTGIGNPPILGLPPHYIWAVVALLAVLVVFYFSDRTYTFLSNFFTFIMFANIVLVLAVTVIAAKPQHYWQVLLGYLGMVTSIGVRQIPHFRRFPHDLRRLPVFVLQLTFLMVPIRIAAFATMLHQGWGTRSSVPRGAINEAPVAESAHV